MDQPIVSIIVPCYKQAEYLPETLDSVMNQSYPNWECVIINDGSPDNTDEIAKQYLVKDCRFKYISQENKGIATARNVGIANSHGEYILPLDADDLIASSYIEKALIHFVDFPETKLVYCKAETFGKKKIPMELVDYDYNNFIWGNCIFCSAIYKRSDFDGTLGYNSNMMYGLEDWDFWLSLLTKEDVVYRIEEVLFYYRVKEISRNTEQCSRYLQESLIQLCKNHPDIYEPFKDRLVLYHSYLEEVQNLEEDINKISSSRAYRLGKFLLRPLSWFRK